MVTRKSERYEREAVHYVLQQKELQKVNTLSRQMFSCCPTNICFMYKDICAPLKKKYFPHFQCCKLSNAALGHSVLCILYSKCNGGEHRNLFMLISLPSQVLQKLTVQYVRLHILYSVHTVSSVIIGYVHRRRIKTEEKAKVVPSIQGKEFI